ncbi:MAG: hypothetical protein M5U26_30315 [Planctomycetota bacterium]|nr:hypothetical protein [Planctomycetota bacterium]
MKGMRHMKRIRSHFSRADEANDSRFVKEPRHAQGSDDALHGTEHANIELDRIVAAAAMDAAHGDGRRFFARQDRRGAAPLHFWLGVPRL